MLNVLRVNCSAAMNEDAKSAVENFAAHLRTVLEQYQNLWDHYIQLNEKYDELKHSVDLSNKEHRNGNNVDSNVICKKHTVENVKDTLIECPKTKVEEKTCNILQDEESDSINEHMLSASISDFESDLDCDISAKSKALARELQTEMLSKSPVMSKGRKKSKKLKNVPKKCLKSLYQNHSSDSSNNHSANVNLFDKESSKTLEKKKLESQSINPQLQLNNSQTSGLEFTVLRNVEVSFPKTGKKMKQSKLLLPSPQKIKDISLFNKSDDKCQPNIACDKTTFPQNDKVSRVEIQKTPEKSLQKPNIYNRNKVETEDIIESTPGRDSPRSVLKSRLMLKRNILSYRQQHSKVPDNKKENDHTTKSDAHSPARSSTSTPLQEKSGNHNNSRPLSLNRKCSKVNDVLTLGNVSEGYGTMSGNERESRIDEPFSPILVELDDTCLDLQINQPVQKSDTKFSAISNCDSMKLSTNPLPIQEFTLSDDTFFEPEEERIRDRQTDENNKKRNTSIEKMLPPPKRVQTDKNNTSHKGNNPEFVYKTDTVRNKAERAKLNGWSCWECKEYYGGLGLSEKELAIRKKQCSRHKAVFDEWRSTPDGFWNHVFPDTVSSSCEDN